MAIFEIPHYTYRIFEMLELNYDISIVLGSLYGFFNLSDKIYYANEYSLFIV